MAIKTEVQYYDIETGARIKIAPQNLINYQIITVGKPYYERIKYNEYKRIITKAVKKGRQYKLDL